MILLLDIGKTNKKCFVFDEDYRIIFEKTTQLDETTDEDGDACENLALLKNWVLESIHEVLNDPRFQIRAINCTTYGASFVHLNSKGEALTPLYNYLKSFPEELRKQFFNTYGTEEKISLETASPMLGNLNSGLQLYWLKHHKPLVFKQIKWSLHLPQYVSFLVSQVVNSNLESGQTTWSRQTASAALRLTTPSRLTNKHEPPKSTNADSNSPYSWMASEITSIGCHTMLWDFRKNDYHDWVKAEGILEKFPPIAKSGGDSKSPPDYAGIQIGTGLHDSSAALIPYLACFDEPFVLISTGTWCISLNPFNQEPLTPEELAQDCLCYLSYEGKPVKAARYFGGHEHEQAVAQIAKEFETSEDFYRDIKLPESLKLSGSFDASYFAFMRQLVDKQALSTRLAIGNTPIRSIFVDGGFCKNETYMTLLAAAFPEIEVYAAEVAQATALGAAMAIHKYWSEKPLSKNMITLKKIRVSSASSVF